MYVRVKSKQYVIYSKYVWKIPNFGFGNTINVFGEIKSIQKWPK